MVLEKKKRRRSILLKVCILVGIIAIVCVVVYSKHVEKKPYISPIPSLFFFQRKANKELEARLKSANISYISVDEHDDAYSAILSTGEEILFSKKKQLDPQVSSLQLILYRLTIEGKRFSRLDLRFDNPVIIFK